MIRRILVAFDGSEPSQRALDYAVELAEGWGAELTMLTVVPRVMLPFLPNEGLAIRIPAARDLGRYQEEMRTIYQNVLAEAEARVRREHPSLKIATRLEEGRPSATIVDVAENGDVDLIVVGSRGLGGITGWILGSTSRRVADSRTRPVLIIK